MNVLLCTIMGLSANRLHDMQVQDFWQPRLEPLLNGDCARALVDTLLSDEPSSN